MDHLESKGAVLIEGAKWCGKTTSAKHIAKSVIEMDRPDMTEQYQQMAGIKPSHLLEGEVPHLIDEWQIATNIWNVINKTRAIHLIRDLLIIRKGGSPPPDPEALILKETLPLRPGRSDPRKVRPQSVS